MRQVHHGTCDSEGHCVNDSEVNKHNLECAAFKIVKSNFTISRTTLYKDQGGPKKAHFMETLFYFLGGLGNALSYASKLSWK